jgi:HEAT repeat protein
MRRIRPVLALTLLVGIAPIRSRAADIDALVAALGGDDEQARAEARQLLPYQSLDAVPKVLPLLSSKKATVWTAAFNVLADFANEVAVPGREDERARMTSNLMTLLATDQPAEIKKRGLRLLPIVAPPSADLGPVAALLDDSDLREKARVALEEMATPSARGVLRARLSKADPVFQVALLNALGRLHDAEALDAITGLTKSDHPEVRVAAVRALAWTGDPGRLGTAREVIGASNAATRPDAIDALLRLANAIECKPEHRAAAMAAYREILANGQGVSKDAALAGLGRVGDASCVGPVLEALRTAEPPTSLVALAALRSMPGEDVTRALVDGFGSLSGTSRTPLIAVLGARKHPAVVPILETAARSDDASTRLAALAALGEAGLPEGLDTLLVAVKKEDQRERQAARAGLLALADALRARSIGDKAGAAYLAVLEAAGPNEKDLRRQAVEGIAAFPTPAAAGAVKSLAADKDLQEPAMRAILAVAGSLAAAKQSDQAAELYEVVRGLNPPADVMKTLAQRLAESGVKVDFQGLLGTITRWWVVGPFDLGDKNQGWDIDYVGEPNVNVVGRYMSGKSRVQWNQVTSSDPNGKIDLRKTVANRDHCLGYAYAEIVVAKPTDAVLLLGVDDSEKVWLNGEKVFELFTPRALKVDQDRVPVKLQEGTNRILLKLYQQSQGWEFCVRVVAPDGRPVPFTQKSE